MEQLRIWGGRPLNGTVEIHGAKNSILPILAASVLCAGRCVITRCPELTDVRAATEILTYLGATAELSGGAVITDTAALYRKRVPAVLMGKMRASVNFLGALLGRFGEGEISLPGGCVLGRRPIDYHISALRTLGVELEERGDRLRFYWPNPRGGEVHLPFPSVGATENLLLAATAVPEFICIRNAAREPEVADLCRFLEAMGADIAGAGTDTLVVRGGRVLHGTAYCVIPDRMEAASYLCMAAACGGCLRLNNAREDTLQPVLEALRQMGCRVQKENTGLLLESSGVLHGGITVTTSAYPGFPTDAQAPVMAALLRAEGDSVVEETVFRERFGHVAQLRRFGGEITVTGSRAVVHGVPQLRPAEAKAEDLRGGAGVLIAALQTRGESLISPADCLRRGYAGLAENLRRLGAVLSEEET